MTWSADVVADDWKHINASEVVRRAIARLDEKGKGICCCTTSSRRPRWRCRSCCASSRRRAIASSRWCRARARRPVPVAAKASACRREAGRTAAPAEPSPRARIAAPCPARRRRSPSPWRSRDAALPEQPARDEPRAARCAGRKPALPASAADSLARGDDIPHDPVRPFTSGSKPARNMPTPGKFVTTEPGGWPPVVSVPVPRGRRRRRVVGARGQEPDAGRALPVAVSCYFSSTVSGLYE